MSDRGYRTLLATIQNLDAGTEVTADLVRAEFDMAQLNTSDRGAAFKAASRFGYLRGTDRVIRSAVASRKNGANRVWIRTRKSIPDHICVITEPTTEKGRIA